MKTLGENILRNKKLAKSLIALTALLITSTVLLLPSAGATTAICDSGSKSTTCTVTSTYSVNSEDISGSGNLAIEDGARIYTGSGSGTTASLSFTDITVKGEVDGNFDISSDNLEVTSSGHINANQAGYSEGGSGQGGSSDSDGGSGGGYGGYGGDAGGDTAPSGGSPYGDEQSPTSLGSSGGSGTTDGSGCSRDYVGGAGGGKLIISVEDTLTVDGSISSNGQKGLECIDDNGGGGGSGGAVNIETTYLEGSGSISAEGGDGNQNGNEGTPGGGGAGGRIFLRYGEDNSNVNKYVSGGKGPSDPGSSYDAENGDSGTVYQETFSVNDAPNSPSNPNPSNGEDIVNIDPALSVDVSDPDGDTVDVTFYDAGDGSTIGTDTGVCSGCTASITNSGDDLGSSTGTSYSWYAVADDGEATTQSSTWSLTTFHKPNSPENPSPPNGASDISTDRGLNVDVFHPDSLNMNITFYINNGSGWNTAGTDKNTADGSTAAVSQELESGQNYDWYTESCSRNQCTQSSTWSFTTDHIGFVRRVDSSGAVLTDESNGFWFLDTLLP